ncbi:hypothetical protein D3C87_1750260 [compost metagenome]
MLPVTPKDELLPVESGKKPKPNVPRLEDPKPNIPRIEDDDLAQANPYTNTYDTHGFITKSVFSVYNGNSMYEITYIYKSI